jgi:ADP-dependent phosphofructokinase/glucokinase
MTQDNDRLDDSVIATLKNKDHSALSKQLDNISCTHTDIIELLAEYQVLSEQEDDDKFDNWYDSLCKEQLNVLKAFEIMRAHYEQS